FGREQETPFAIGWREEPALPADAEGQLVTARCDLRAKIETRGVIEEVDAKIFAAKVETRLDARRVGKRGEIRGPLRRAVGLRRRPVAGLQPQRRIDGLGQDEARQAECKRRDQSKDDTPGWSGQRKRRIPEERDRDQTHGRKAYPATYFRGTGQGALRKS